MAVFSCDANHLWLLDTLFKISCGYWNILIFKLIVYLLLVIWQILFYFYHISSIQLWTHPTLDNYHKINSYSQHMHRWQLDIFGSYFLIDVKNSFVVWHLIPQQQQLGRPGHHVVVVHGHGHNATSGPRDARWGTGQVTQGTPTRWR